jgi:Carboxypeptidase regulatory-like domain
MIPRPPWLLLALIWLGAAIVRAQTGDITGRVLALDGAPVPGAQVVVLPAGPRTTTDAAGLFHVRGIAAGRHELLIRRPGYRPDTLHLVVPTPQPSVTVFLAPLPERLKPVLTTALAADLPRVVDRERQGISVVVTGDSLRKEFPGFSVDAAIQYDSALWKTLRGWRFCVDMVFIDGKPMPPSPWRDPTMPQPDFDIRDQIRMRDIAAVEVTRELEKVDEPWVDQGSAVSATRCVRAVLIWTKGFKQKPYKGP